MNKKKKDQDHKLIKVSWILYTNEQTNQKKKSIEDKMLRHKQYYSLQNVILGQFLLISRS